MISLGTLALLTLIAVIPTLAGAAAGYFAGHKSGTTAGAVSGSVAGANAGVAVVKEHAKSKKSK